jgi:hypothetical protein
VNIELAVGPRERHGQLIQLALPQSQTATSQLKLDITRRPRAVHAAAHRAALGPMTFRHRRHSPYPRWQQSEIDLIKAQLPTRARITGEINVGAGYLDDSLGRDGAACLPPQARFRELDLAHVARNCECRCATTADLTREVYGAHRLATYAEFRTAYRVLPGCALHCQRGVHHGRTVAVDDQLRIEVEGGQTRFVDPFEHSPQGRQLPIERRTILTRRITS